MPVRIKSEKAVSTMGRHMVALVVSGSLASACAPVSPSSYPSAGSPMAPYGAMASGGYRPTAPSPYTYRQPVLPVGTPVPAPPQAPAPGSSIERDALLGGAGFLLGRQTAPTPITSAAVDEAETGAVRGGATVAADATVASGLGAAEGATARTVAVTGVRTGVASAVEVGAAEIAADAALAEGGEVAVAAAIGDVVVPALLIGGGGYIAYRLLTDPQSDH